jgi:hypothetical protein
MGVVLPVLLVLLFFLLAYCILVGVPSGVYSCWQKYMHFINLVMLIWNSFELLMIYSSNMHVSQHN